jgi:ATP-dependent Lon protease
MRDYRDAKAMARRLRGALAERGAHFAHTDCLELIARSFGLKDWHVLSAMIAAAEPQAAPGAPWSGPALLLRDIVVFPKLTVPVFIGREMSVRAQQRACEGESEVLLVTQKERSDDHPSADAVYGVGVIADVLERTVLADGTVKLRVRGRQRARLLALTDEAGYPRAEAAPALSPSADFVGADGLVRDAVASFEAYAVADGRFDEATRAWIRGVTHVGVLADLIAAHAHGSIADKQVILETLDPRARLVAALRLLPGQSAQAA